MACGVFLVTRKGCPPVFSRKIPILETPIGMFNGGEWLGLS